MSTLDSHAAPSHNHSQGYLKSIDGIREDVPTINEYDQRSKHQIQIWKSLELGNIIPDGPIEETPVGMKIQLKEHQKRMLYEMLVKEKLPYRVSSGVNAFCIADKVGAGKSMEILSLISRAPYVEHTASNKITFKAVAYRKIVGVDLRPTIEFRTNLIVVPHGIYNQWVHYITSATTLQFLGIATRKDIRNLELSKLSEESAPQILLVKSTRYNDLCLKILSRYPMERKAISVNEYRVNTRRTTLLSTVTTARSKTLQVLRRYTNSGEWIRELSVLKQVLNTISDEEFNQAEQYFETDQFYELSQVHKVSGPVFQRVIFDEANSIQIPNCCEMIAKYHWFVTSSISELLFPRGRSIWHSGKYIETGSGLPCKGFIRDTFQRNSFDNLANWMHVVSMYLKNEDDFVKASFALEEPRIHHVRCFTPPEYMALKNISVPEVLQALNAGDITTAVETIGCPVASKTSITELVLQKLNQKCQSVVDKILKKNELLTTLKSKLLSLQQQLQNLPAEEEQPEEIVIAIRDLKNRIRSVKASLKLFTEKKDSITVKIQALSERISNIDTKTCPICTDTVQNACLTHCCNNAFCFECLTQSVKYSPRCPLCRTQVNLQQITVISNEAEAKLSKKRSLQKNLPTKMDYLIRTILSKPQGRFLVFSEYDNTFNLIMEKLTTEEITFSKLNGSTGRVTNIIQAFKDGKIQVLLLNAKHYGSGLNLQCCTDIILYHRMNNDLEKQIIGRGQRPGRQSRLNVQYLCYETEI